MNDSTSNTSPSKTRAAYLKRYEELKRAGLKDVKFYPGDVATATVETFMAESLAIDLAIEEGRHSPLPDTI